jgi:hypothetical protein
MVVICGLCTDWGQAQISRSRANNPKQHKSDHIQPDESTCSIAQPETLNKCATKHQRKREGDPKGWSMVLITTLGSWEKLVPLIIILCNNKSICLRPCRTLQLEVDAAPSCFFIYNIIHMIVHRAYNFPRETDLWCWIMWDCGRYCVLILAAATSDLCADIPRRSQQ